MAEPLYRPRSSWQSALNPVTSSLAPVWSQQVYQVIHWTGGVNSQFFGVPTGAIFDAKVQALLRAVQADYTRNRGYSIGYNYCVPPDDRNGYATAWELRGDTYRCAANGDVNNNIAGQAILLLCASFNRATKAQIATVRWLISNKIRNRAPQAVGIVGHNQIRVGGTACPMPFIPDVHDGVFQPLPAPPLPGPTPLEDDVALIARFQGDNSPFPVFYTSTTWRRAVSLEDIQQQKLIGAAKYGPDGKEVTLPFSMATTSKQVT